MSMPHTRPHPFWGAPHPLILASASATRRGLLEAAGVPVEIIPATLDEKALAQDLADAAPDQVALALAVAKGRAVASDFPDRLTVAADQVLVFEGRILFKAENAKLARAQLAAMAGKSHRLVSAAVLMAGKTELWRGATSATLHMRSLSPVFLDAYCDAMGAGLMRSVGAYEIERLGIHLFSAIEGEHSTILGLPMLPLLAALRDRGALLS